jgi:predicted nucleic acid-binding protein
MNDVVVDSSVMAKWFLPEPDSAQAQRLLTETVSAGGRLIVVDLAFPEVASAIWKRQRQGMITPGEADQMLDALIRCPVHVEPSFRLLRSGFALAVQYDRSIYDALFAALANDLGLPGVTADQPLYSALHTHIPRITLLRDWP